MRWIIPLLLFFVLQWYGYQAVKTISSQRWILAIYFLVVVIIIGNLLLHTMVLERNTNTEPRLMYAIGFFITLFVFQALVSILLLGEDIFKDSASCLCVFYQDARGNRIFPQAT